MSDYIVVIDGTPKGPYQLEELKKLGIKSGTFVRKPGMDDYKEAHEIPELRTLLGFKFQETAPQYFASFDQRLLAMVIDYFFIVLAYVVVLLLIFVFVEGKEQRMVVALTGLPSVFVAKLIYSSIADASVKQGTIGKRLLDIKVTDMLGNRLSTASSFARNISKLLSIIPLFFGYLYSFLNRKQQCWHDIIADAIVVKQRLI